MTRILMVLCLLLAAPLAGAEELTLRHSLQGKALDTLSSLVVKFNGEQKGGKDKIVLEDAAGVTDKHQLPGMALLNPDERQQFFDTLPRFKPIYQVMQEGGVRLDSRQFYPQLAEAVGDLSGRMQGLPIAMDVPVLLYNKDAFVKAGLNPDKPPKTWWEVQNAAGSLYDAGFRCPLTTSHFAWVHLENVANQNGEPMLEKVGKSERVHLNQLINVKHIALLSSWYKSEYFHYYGPGREGDEKFASGECAMLTSGSSVANDLQASKFAVGVADLPYYDDERDSKPANVLPDGAALWALPGRSKAQYRLAARFVGFLMRPDVQREWVQGTGFLPMTKASTEALRAAGAAPAVLAAVDKRLTMPSKRLERLEIGSGRSRVREILDEEIAFVWKNVKPAKEALDTAMARADSVLTAALGVKQAVAAPIGKKRKGE